MYTLVLCVAATAVGIDAGWQRSPEGGMEYIIQLDPESMRSLSNGQTLQSDVPPVVGEMRSYRIIMGTDKLPRETPSAKPTLPKATERKEPSKLPPDPFSKLIGETHTSYVSPPKTPPAPAAETSKDKTPDVAPEQPDRPWVPFVVAMFGLFASLGANVFLGWVAVDYHRRYREKCCGG